MKLSKSSLLNNRLVLKQLVIIMLWCICSAIAALPRIVTLHDFVIEGKQVKEKADIPEINYSLKQKPIVI
jgi:hypothetical protein